MDSNKIHVLVQSLVLVQDLILILPQLQLQHRLRNQVQLHSQHPSQLLNQKYNIGIGKTYFIFNFFLFGFSLLVLEIDLVIASLILVFITSVVLESTLALFNQRKLVLIISDNSREIADGMINHLKMGATFIRGQGAYSGQDKNIVMAITNNIVLKRLEELVFSKDANAIFIVENTFNVLGSSFAKRKIY